MAESASRTGWKVRISHGIIPNSVRIVHYWTTLELSPSDKTAILTTYQ
ncbi:hypothetical protein BN903_141 [Halorubrum sp. AJ67]|nr:hypothetical protein BN903_141 [Halorubrum sp. AJ67]